MIEKVSIFLVNGEPVIEKVVDTKDVSIAHAVIEKGGKFPKHTANANVKIILIKGELNTVFGTQQQKKYAAGTIIEVPKGTEMELSNAGFGNVEFFAVKAPSPTFK